MSKKSQLDAIAGRAKENARKAFGLGDGELPTREQLFAEFAKILPPENIERLRDRRARELFDRLFDDKAPKDAPLLRMMGEEVPYNPRRFIEGPDNRVARVGEAGPEFTKADAVRSRDKSGAALALTERKEWIAERHEAWAIREIEKGRPREELGLDNCLKETGLLVEPAKALPKSA